jgi:hypothetical protein
MFTRDGQIAERKDNNEQSEHRDPVDVGARPPWRRAGRTDLQLRRPRAVRHLLGSTR